MLGGKEQKVWPNEKLTHITYRSISILKHPSFDKTQDLETGDTAFVYSIFASSFYQSLRSIDSFSLNQAVFFFFFWGGGEGGGWYGSTTVALSLFPLPLEKGIPDRKMELISKTATGDQVLGPRREKGHEQSNMRFLLYRDEAKISCNTEMY